MYKIYHNDKLIYSPRSPDVTLGKAELTQQANCAGAIQIIMYPQNPAYKSVKEMASIITVKDDDETIYEGRVTTINDEISFEKTLQAEGALAYLNDSVIRPFSFSGDVQEFVTKILKEHNAQVEEGKQILVGNIGVQAALKITEEEYTTALDICFMGALEVDQYGNINAHRGPGAFAGIGGFANITAKTPTVVFCMSFNAKGLTVSQKSGEITIEKEGSVPKFVEHVNSISFSSKRAIENGQKVLYVTERCVFRLTPKGLKLIEVYPGIDAKRDILDQLPFEVEYKQ